MSTREPVPQRRAIATPAAEIQRERVEWLVPWRVPLGMVTVLGGIGGLGKSTWTALLAADNPGVTLIATAEDSPSTTVRPRLEAVGADLERVSFVSIQADDGFEDGITIPDDISELDELVGDIGANLLIVDPLVAHLPGQIDSHKDQSVRRALAPLYRLADARGCAVVAVMHLNKAQGLAPLARLGGSAAFGNLARSVLLLDRDPDDPDGEMGRRRVLAHLKCNVAPEAPSLLYRVEAIVLPADGTQPEVETSRLELLGESEHNGPALLALASAEERSAGEEAVEFLAAELADGQRYPAGDLFKAARQLGIADRTLKRARKKLGVETEKAGFGRGWEWWLPKGPTPVAPSQASDEWPLRETPLSMRDSGASKVHETPEGARHQGWPLRGDLAPSGDLDQDEVERVADVARDALADLGRTSLTREEREHLKAEVDRRARAKAAAPAEVAPEIKALFADEEGRS